MDFHKVLTEEEYDKLFVTSDTHFNHNKEFIFATRGYKDPLSMTDDMINIINDTVGEDGTLLHLGDFCLNTLIGEFHALINRLRVKNLWLLHGNHNNPHVNLDFREVHTFSNIEHYGHYLTFRRSKRMYVCFHFPIHVWDGMDKGVMHLCGHSHGGLSLSRPENKQHKILDCGWDVHHKPISMKDIERIMDSKAVNNLHH